MNLAEYNRIHYGLRFRQTRPTREPGLEVVAPHVRKVFVAKLLVLVGTALSLATRDAEVAFIAGTGAACYWLFFVKE